VIKRLTGYIERDWAGMYSHIFTALGRHAIALRFKNFVSNERPKLLTLCEHHQINLMGVYGEGADRERLVGYCLLFSGAPTIHHYTRYLGVSYSEVQDIRGRQLKMLYDDDDVRLARMGMGVFDYLLVCRKLTEEQLEIDAPDHAAYHMFKHSWKDGT